MKKPFYVLMISILIMFVSCDKDSNDPTEPDYPMEITNETLDGNWEFVSLNVPSAGDLTECDELTGWMTGWKVFLEFEFNYATLKVKCSDKCTGEILYENENYSVNSDGDGIEITGARFYSFTYDNLTGKLTIKIPSPSGGGGYVSVTVRKI